MRKKLKQKKKVWGLHKHPHLSTRLPWSLWILLMFLGVKLPCAKQLSRSVKSTEGSRGLLHILMSFQYSTQRFLCSSDQPCSDAYLKIRQTLNSVLAPEGTAASSFQRASSVLQGIGSLVSAPIQILKWKECKRRGQKRGEEGGRGCRDAGRKQVKKWRQRGKEKSEPRL